MKKEILAMSTIMVFTCVVLLLAAGFNPIKAQGPLGRPNIWADCELFMTVATPATFDPAHGPFDELYGGGNGFKDGVPLISECKPGDQDYNGGRWHLNVLKASVSPDKYENACSVEDLDLNDFESTNNYFECPLLPRRGHGHE
jgi:hypothetical protein